MPQECTICKIIKDESEFICLNRDKGVQLAKSCRECNSKTMKKKRVPWSQHINICGSGKMVAKLRVRGRLLMIISVIPAINAEKKNQWKNLGYMAQNTIQNYLRYVKSVMIIVEKKTKDGKEVSLKKNGTGMGIQ